MKSPILRPLFVLVVLFFSLPSFAASLPGGVCPTPANYLNPATNQHTTLAKLGVTACFYIAANGSDSNSGTSESAPWAHAPGMASCSGICASETPAPGTGFIFRGGDTWAASSSYFNITAGGSNGAPIYYGVDFSWYSGLYWNRPILSVGGTLPNVDSNGESRIIDARAGWITFDWWEVTGMTCTSSKSQNLMWDSNTNDGLNLLHSYVHLFEAPASLCPTSTKLSDGNNPAIWLYTRIATNNSACHGYFEYNVVDGTDGTGTKGYQTVVADPSPCATFAYNVIHDVCSGIGGNLLNPIHDNVIGNFGGQIGQFSCGSAPGLHNHAIRSNVDATIYNNVIYGTLGEVISANPHNSITPTLIYNNVVYSNGTNLIELCDNGGGCSAGKAYILNNTLDAQSGTGGSCLNVENAIGYLLTDNNFDIFSGAPSGSCYYNSKNAASYPNPQGELSMTLSEASAAGFTTAQNFVDSPTSSTSPTIGIGVAGILPSDAQDTTYACAERTVNGVVEAVCPARTVQQRAQSGTCTSGVSGCMDAGAYQYLPGLMSPYNLSGSLIAH